MSDKIALALLWHQHQPYYKDLETNRAIMPWVRLHATKDYYDMAAILDEFPNVRLTINLVPSLLAQLDDFSKNQVSDPWLEKTLIPAKQLKEDDKVWILEHFFYCNWDTMIFPNKRYGELFEKRGRTSSREEIKRKRAYFSAQDFLDLQVWFNLAWMDPYWQERDALVKDLYRKGQHFTEADKSALIDKQREICGMIAQKHKELWDRGQIEISTTPFYHPILPLLCDTDAAQIAMPGSLKPKQRFQHPEDAQLQVEKALDFMERTFGRRPAGMWPSEGSVSEETAAVLSRAGVRWAATDEGVLYHSMRIAGTPLQGREQIYQPYRVQPESQTASGGGSLDMIFRDHSLSDAIGFVYSRMDPQKAVEDFVGRVCKIADSIPQSDRPPLVSVILDGENCWEHYPRDGQDFLRALYGALSHHPRIQTTTVSGYLDAHPTQNTLKQLWAGSWINANFAIWIGHPEDNLAWDWVFQTRKFLAEYVQSRPDRAGSAEVLKAKESLWIAEGSDWCWWYGDQNYTAQDAVFDELFRKHLGNVYTLLGSKPPEKLGVAIKQKEDKDQSSTPVGLIHPRIDGLVTTYFEWRSGGSYHAAGSGGAMHAADRFLSSLHYGFDMDKLYLRLDPRIPFKESDLADHEIRIHFLEPQDIVIILQMEKTEDGSGRPRSYIKEAKIISNQARSPGFLKDYAIDKILELAIPFDTLGAQPNEGLEFIVTVHKGGLEAERWPHQNSVLLKRPGDDFGLEHWSA